MTELKNYSKENEKFSFFFSLCLLIFKEEEKREKEKKSSIQFIMQIATP